MGLLQQTLATWEQQRPLRVGATAEATGAAAADAMRAVLLPARDVQEAAEKQELYDRGGSEHGGVQAWRCVKAVEDALATWEAAMSALSTGDVVVVTLLKPEPGTVVGVSFGAAPHGLGVSVTDLKPEGAAAAALLLGDVVIAVDGTLVLHPNTAAVQLRAGSGPLLLEVLRIPTSPSAAPSAPSPAAAAMPPAELYYYLDGEGGQQGPVPGSQLVEWLRAGQAAPSTYVFAADGSMAGWEALASQEALLQQHPAALPAASDASAVASQPSASLAERLSEEEEAAQHALGALVLISGLHAKPELNDREANIVGWDATKGRYNVR
eukprot:7385300-Prymnesium_polylepis.1